MLTDMLIGSGLVSGQGPGQPVINPATGTLIDTIAEASDAQVDAAVRAAERAFPAWSRTTPGERAAMLLKIADGIETHAEAFAQLESPNCGKPLPRV